MLREGRLLGVINVESDQPNAFDIHDSLLAEALADAVALALDNAHLHLSVETERRRLDALIKSSRDGIIFIGNSGVLRVVNAAALRLLRLPGQPEDWSARPIVEMLNALRHFAPIVARTTLADIRRMQRGDETTSEGVYEVGSYTLHWFSLPVDSGALSMGRLFILHNVTEERRLKEMRDDLTGMMVHDMRNPLTVILAALEMFIKIAPQPLSTNAEKLLDMAMANSELLLNMVNSILEISRLESGQMPLRYEQSALPPLIVELLQRQAPLIKTKNIHIENNVPLELPLVNIDQGMIRRVLQNLLDNALKFTPENGSIGVSAKYTNTSTNCVTVSISNSGPGIKPELKEQLFQKFVTGQEKERGSGLGLAFCRLVVEAHGGKMRFESEPDHETVFHFTLPV